MWLGSRCAGARDAPPPRRRSRSCRPPGPGARRSAQSRPCVLQRPLAGLTGTRPRDDADGASPRGQAGTRPRPPRGAALGSCVIPLQTARRPVAFGRSGARAVPSAVPGQERRRPLVGDERGSGGGRRRGRQGERLVGGASRGGGKGGPRPKPTRLGEGHRPLSRPGCPGSRVEGQTRHGRHASAPPRAPSHGVFRMCSAVPYRAPAVCQALLQARGLRRVNRALVGLRGEASGEAGLGQRVEERAGGQVGGCGRGPPRTEMVSVGIQAGKEHTLGSAPPGPSGKHLRVEVTEQPDDHRRGPKTRWPAPGRTRRPGRGGGMQAAPRGGHAMLGSAVGPE